MQPAFFFLSNVQCISSWHPQPQTRFGWLVSLGVSIQFSSAELATTLLDETITFIVRACAYVSVCLFEMCMTCAPHTCISLYRKSIVPFSIQQLQVRQDLAKRSKSLVFVVVVEVHEILRWARGRWQKLQLQVPSIAARRHPRLPGPEEGRLQHPPVLRPVIQYARLT